MASNGKHLDTAEKLWRRSHTAYVIGSLVSKLDGYRCPLNSIANHRDRGRSLHTTLFNIVCRERGASGVGISHHFKHILEQPSVPGITAHLGEHIPRCIH